MFISLSDDETIKFQLWLKQEIESYKVIIDQMKKIPGQNIAIKTFEIKIDALQIVFNHLLVEKL